jgi:tetratricopeptide (TPR) repeat protein
MVEYATGDYRRAETSFREALEIQRALHGETHPSVAIAMNNLAFTLHDQGELEQAEKMYRDVLAMQRKLLGNDHPDVALALNNLATVQRDRGDLEGAIASSTESLDIYRRAHGGQHPSVARGLLNLAVYERERGNLAAAETMLRESLDIRRELLEPDHPDIAKSEAALAGVLVEAGQFEEARSLAASAHETFAASLGEAHWRTAAAASTEGAAEAGMGNYGNAEKLLLDSYAVLEADPAVREIYVRETLERLAGLYRAWGKDAEARRYAALLDAS